MVVHLNTSSLSTCFLLTLPLQSGRRRPGYLSEGRHGLVVRWAERTERTFPFHVRRRAACFYCDEVIWSLASKEHVKEKSHWPQCHWIMIHSCCRVKHFKLITFSWPFHVITGKIIQMNHTLLQLVCSFTVHKRNI